ncbi:hypothetical protein DRE_06612 [Drechslerella stenobrocha 248]|uniref:Uncharacterized protein n=1 Tax=Drechslerella stenobrocha 248 TaxID=1043628 RepID=W7HXI1_9PEZI|nr:hypothetical protein DRE_06612 [Drechslerella stenobrocha 248]
MERGGRLAIGSARSRARKRRRDATKAMEPLVFSAFADVLYNNLYTTSNLTTVEQHRREVSSTLATSRLANRVRFFCNINKVNRKTFLRIVNAVIERLAREGADSLRNTESGLEHTLEQAAPNIPHQHEPAPMMKSQVTPLPSHPSLKAEESPSRIEPLNANALVSASYKLAANHSRTLQPLVGRAAAGDADYAKQQVDFLEYDEYPQMDITPTLGRWPESDGDEDGAIRVDGKGQGDGKGNIRGGPPMLGHSPTIVQSSPMPVTPNISPSAISMPSMSGAFSTPLVPFNPSAVQVVPSSYPGALGPSVVPVMPNPHHRVCYSLSVPTAPPILTEPLALAAPAVTNSPDGIFQLLQLQLPPKPHGSPFDPSPLPAASSSAVAAWAPDRSSSVRLPYPLQHHLTTEAQRILENACFDFVRVWLPSRVATEEFAHPVNAELNKWARLIRSKLSTLPPAAYDDTVFGVCMSGVAQELFQQTAKTIEQLRHTAVHRVKTDAHSVMQMLELAVLFARFLRDNRRADELRHMINGAQATMARQVREGGTETEKEHLKRQLEELERELSELRSWNESRMRVLGQQEAGTTELQRGIVEAAEEITDASMDTVAPSGGGGGGELSGLDGQTLSTGAVVLDCSPLFYYMGSPANRIHESPDGL